MWISLAWDNLGGSIFLFADVAITSNLHSPQPGSFTVKRRKVRKNCQLPFKRVPLGEPSSVENMGELLHLFPFWNKCTLLWDTWNLFGAGPGPPREGKRHAVAFLNMKQVHVRGELCASGLLNCLQVSSGFCFSKRTVDSQQCNFCFYKLKENISKTKCKKVVSLLKQSLSPLWKQAAGQQQGPLHTEGAASREWAKATQCSAQRRIVSAMKAGCFTQLTVQTGVCLIVLALSVFSNESELKTQCA